MDKDIIQSKIDGCLSTLQSIPSAEQRLDAQLKLAGDDVLECFVLNIFARAIRAILEKMPDRSKRKWVIDKVREDLDLRW